jgi:branched-chain amino acid transport system permease protein
VFVLSGLVAAAVGLAFGIPSLRIKGFYLAVATLAAQFFLIWLFNKVPVVRELRVVRAPSRRPPRRMLG